MDILEHMRNLRLREFQKVKKDFIRDLHGTFLGFSIGNGRIDGYSEHILNLFLKLNFRSEFNLDFELNSIDFNYLRWLEFSEDEWMSVYGLFEDIFKYGNKLNPFIYLFFYDLIYEGPFSEDIEALDMSDDLLSLMGDEMLRLYHLFDDYFNTHDTGLLKDMVDASRQVSIPSFVVIHLANWINEDIDDKEKFGDLICELYVIAIEKIYKKPKIYAEDDLTIDSIRFEVDTSNFNESQVDYVYSKIN